MYNCMTCVYVCSTEGSGSLGQTEVIEGCRLEETEAVPLNTAITEQYAVLTALAAVVRVLNTDRA